MSSLLVAALTWRGKLSSDATIGVCGSQPGGALSLSGRGEQGQAPWGEVSPGGRYRERVTPAACGGLPTGHRQALKSVLVPGKREEVGAPEARKIPPRRLREKQDGHSVGAEAGHGAEGEKRYSPATGMIHVANLPNTSRPISKENPVLFSYS